MRLRLFTLASLCWLSACDRSMPADTAATTAERHPIHVDSILPLEEDLRRLRQGLVEPAGLTDAAATLDELVARLGDAVAAGDRTALDRMTISLEEFAWFYYPEQPQAQPPTRLGSGLMWMMIRENSDKGRNAAIQKLGGRPLAIESRECAAPAKRGGTTIVYPCRFWIGGFSGPVRLFGEVLVRPEGFKFVSLANTLD